MGERQRLGDPPSAAMLEAVDEIMTIYRSLPPRHTIEEVEAATSILATVNAQEAAQLEELSKLKTSSSVPEDLGSVLREVKTTVVLFQSHELRKDALFVVESDKLFHVFDGLIQRASAVVSGGSEEQNTVKSGHCGGEISGGGVGQGEVSLLVKKKFVGDGVSDNEGLRHLTRINSTNAVISAVNLYSTEGESEKLSMMKVAALIEKSATNKSTALDLKGRLMDQIEWLPVSIGKLLHITSLDLSDNRIMALPNSIGNLKSLVMLNIHSNQIINLPESIGELTSLTDLDCHANRMRSLPSSLPNLTSLKNFDLSSNEFTQLPGTIGNLTSLQKLNVETNDLEDLPYAIGSCSALIELKLDFNRLRALPEAIGKLGSLETLSLHYNKIKALPTTVGELSSLRELDLSFNELESVPESLCFAVSLVKLNVGKNFADLRALPRSIGNLEMLEELDISDNQIRVLPESIRLLSRLRVLRADETPLELPPKEIVKLGAQAVVVFMDDYVTKRNLKLKQQSKKKKKSFWLWFCGFICSNHGASKNKA